VRHRSVAWAAVALLGAFALGGCSRSPSAPPQVARPDPQPRNVFDICAIYREKPHWERAATMAERPMKTENGRKVPASSAFGFSQAIDGTWAWYQEDTGNPRANRTEFADAIDFVGWYVDKTQELNGLPPWDAFSQYLAYHEGHRGYERGTWRQKPELLRAATEVAQQAQRYRAQRARCGGAIASADGRRHASALAVPPG
jgi:hypothetical protein